MQLRIECQNLSRCGGSPCEGQLEAKYQSPTPHTVATGDWLCMLDPANKSVKNNQSQFSLSEKVVANMERWSTGRNPVGGE